MPVWDVVGDEGVTIVSELLEENVLGDFVDVINVFEPLDGFVDVTETLEVLDSFVDVTVELTAVHGVVGLALAQAQRELAAPKTLPAEAPQALITQYSAADWIAED
jgi:hypothetical protein